MGTGILPFVELSEIFVLLILFVFLRDFGRREKSLLTPFNVKLAKRRTVLLALRERGNGGEGTIMAGLRVIAIWAISLRESFASSGAAFLP